MVDAMGQGTMGQGTSQVWTSRNALGNSMIKHPLQYCQTVHGICLVVKVNWYFTAAKCRTRSSCIM